MDYPKVVANWSCFNPRLARAGEATWTTRKWSRIGRVSIRASPVRARRPRGGWAKAYVELVSIRASPVRARRRGTIITRLESCRRFNPRLARAGEATMLIA